MGSGKIEKDGKSIMKIEVKVPSIGESINEVTMGPWLKENDSFVETDDVLCEVESEKATMEIIAEQSGILRIMVSTGQTAQVGSVIAEISSPEKKAAKKVESAAAIKTESQNIEKKEAGQESKSKISPLAANILKEAGLSVEQISGSGISGKVTKSDALRAVEKAETIPVQEKRKESAEIISAGSENRHMRRERMSTLRKTISRRMLEAKQGTAMLTTINEIDMSAIMEIRKKYKEMYQQKYDVSLGFMSFFTKAVTIALKEFPVINAMIDGDEIVYHDYCDISIAVSTPKGLVVPVIRNAEKLSMSEIELVVTDLATKARDNKLTIEEMSGGTFSITNGGVFGSLISTPLINTPQAAILGMHTIQERPVARNGQVVIRPMMYVSLSYDHRIIDGRESVSFLVLVKEILEDPVRMLLFS